MRLFVYSCVLLVLDSVLTFVLTLFMGSSQVMGQKVYSDHKLFKQNISMILLQRKKLFT